MTETVEVTVDLEAVLEERAARVFATPDENGDFCEAAFERIYAPVLQGLNAELLLIEQPDGWRGGAKAKLPMAELSLAPNRFAPLRPTRALAVAEACEALILWCSVEKDKPGSKRRIKQAAAIQEWALAVEKQHAPPPPEITVVSVGNGVSASVQFLGDPRTSLHGGETAAPSALRARANSGELKTIPLSELHESPWNPRQSFPEEALESLAASMRADGFWEWAPLMARPLKEGGYELGAGHRRRRAAERAGIHAVPVVVRELTDEQFLDILNFDNTGREDVHPLHEAEGWQQWMERTGKGVLDIAKRMGKSKEVIYERLQYRKLIPEAKTAFLEDRIKKGHAREIARWGAKEQARILQVCEPPEWNPNQGLISTRDLVEWIKKNLHLDLCSAPFSLLDAELLPSAGSCESCPQLVGNLPDFNPLEDIPNICMAAPCYESKIAAHVEAEKVRLKKQLGYLYCLSERNDSKTEGVLPHSEWHRMPPNSDASNAKIGLMIDGPKIGCTLSVVIQERLPIPPEAPPALPASKPVAAMHEKPDPKKAADEKAARDRETQRQKREALAREQQAKDARALLDRESAVRKKLLAAILEKVEWPPSKAGVGRLLEDWLGELPEALDSLVEAQGVKSQTTQVDWSRVSPRQVARLVAIVMLADDLDEFNLSHGAKKLDAAAKQYGVDTAAVRKRAMLEHAVESCEIDFDANLIECKPSKHVLAEIRFTAKPGGKWFVAAGVSLPTKAGEGYGEFGPLHLAGTTKYAEPGEAEWKDPGAAIDAAFAWMTKFLAKAPAYSGATEATRVAAEQVRRWVKSGTAARAAMLALEPRAEVKAPEAGTRKSIAKLPTLDEARAGKKKSAPEKAAPSKKAPAKKAGKK